MVLGNSAALRVPTLKGVGTSKDYHEKLPGCMVRVVPGGGCGQVAVWSQSSRQRLPCRSRLRSSHLPRVKMLSVGG